MADFNPYHTWLGIPPEDQPPHFYRLLGLAPLESDPDVIQHAADRAMAHLRTFQSGKHGPLSQKLLNEVAAAKLCLLHKERKAAYDVAIKKKLGMGGRPAMPVAKALPMAQALPKSAPAPAKTAAPAPAGVQLNFDPLAGKGSALAPRSAKQPAWKKPVVLGPLVLIVCLAIGAAVYALSRSGVPADSPSPEFAGTADGNVPPKKSIAPPAVTPGAADPNVGASRPVDPKTTGAAAETGAAHSTALPAHAIDLLSLIQLPRAVAGGDFQRQGTDLVTVVERNVAMVPYVPPEEYTLTIVVERIAGDRQLVVGLVTGGKRFMLQLDAQNHQLLLGGAPSPWQGVVIPPTGRHTLTFEVRTTGLTLQRDQTKIFEWHGDYSTLWVNRDWKMPSGQQLFIGSIGLFRISQLTLTPITGQGKIEAPDQWPATVGAPDAMKPVDLLTWINPQRDQVWGGFQKPGPLQIPKTTGARLLIPYFPPKWYDVNLVAERKAGDDCLTLGLVAEGGQFGATLDSRHGTMSALESIDRRNINDAKPRLHRSGVLPLGKPVNVSYKVRPHRTTVTVDGQTVIDWAGDYHRLATPDAWSVRDIASLYIGAWDAQFEITKLELVPVADTEPPSAGALGVPLPRLPAPDSAAIDKAKGFIATVFGSDAAAAKRPSEKTLLAQAYLQESLEPWQNVTERYVLCTLARDAAIEAADPTTALKAIDALSDAFDVDPIQLKLDALTKLSTGPSANRAAVIDVALQAANDAATGDNLDQALRFGKLALDAAKALKDPARIRQVVARGKELTALQKDFAEVQPQLAAAQNGTADAATAAAAGRWLCLVRGDWRRGLPLLAKSSDPALQALAMQELNLSDSPDDALKLADAWWDYGQSADGVARTGAQSRAYEWYAQSHASATGVNKLKAEKRLEDLKTALGTDQVVKLDRQPPGPSPAVTARFQPGLVAELFDDRNWEHRVKARVDPLVDFDWGNFMIAENFKEDCTIRWSGWLVPPSAGKYRLVLIADDKSDLWIDDQKVVEQKFVGSPTGVNLELSAQPHRVRLDYLNYAGAANMRLRWSKEGSFAERPIGPEFLFHNPEAATLVGATELPAIPRPPASDQLEPGLAAKYYQGSAGDVQLFERVDAQPNFWQPETGTLIPGMPAEDFSIRWSGYLVAPTPGRYKLWVYHDDGARLWLDGKLVINKWSIGVDANQGVVELTGQPQPVKIEYFQGAGLKQLHLQWQPVGGLEQTIPASAFFHAK